MDHQSILRAYLERDGDAFASWFFQYPLKADRVLSTLTVLRDKLDSEDVAEMIEARDAAGTLYGLANEAGVPLLAEMFYSFYEYVCRKITPIVRGWHEGDLKDA
jgi:cytochrome oxidase Cu insertion factor (SCO1/SenC/PrrC family)